jgi:putative ABC transport system ATP-binding protein
MDIFTELNKEGITIVMVTHEPDIAKFAKHNVHMRDGLIEKVHIDGKEQKNKDGQKDKK